MKMRKILSLIEAIGESTNEDEIKNDLKEFGVDSDAPDLFSSENRDLFNRKSVVPRK